MDPDEDRRAFRGAWVPRILVLVLGGASAARVASAWNELPARMASHFGISGRPDGFTSREGFFGMMALVGGGVIGLLLLLPVLLRYCPPELINLPNRQYWLAPERRQASMERLGTWFAWFALATGALLCFVLELVIRANLEQRSLENQSLLLGLGVYLVSVIALLIQLFRSFSSRHADRGGDGAGRPRSAPG